MSSNKISYGTAIREAFVYLLKKHPKVFVVGQGLWSPWYVGNSMSELEKEFGKKRIIDCPVSEAASTGLAIGASLCGYRAIIVHPRMDFMFLAMDQIINQAAKWRFMYAGQANCAVTIRGIINRGGEQGAQHSQALQSLFAHIPGLHVVMPTTVKDARDLLIASVLCDDPVLYIDDRWLYELEDTLPPVKDVSLKNIEPQILNTGTDITLVASSYSTNLCLQAAKKLIEKNISCEVIDLRVLNPLKTTKIINSVKKTQRLCVVDGGWKNCGMAGEIIASVCETIPTDILKTAPKRITLPDTSAPTSKPLEEAYYPQITDIITTIKSMVT